MQHLRTIYSNLRAASFSRYHRDCTAFRILSNEDLKGDREAGRSSTSGARSRERTTTAKLGTVDFTAFASSIIYCILQFNGIDILECLRKMRFYNRYGSICIKTSVTISRVPWRIQNILI